LQGLGRDDLNRDHFSPRLPVFPDRTTTFLQKATTHFPEEVISAPDWRSDALPASGKDIVLQRYKGQILPHTGTIRKPKRKKGYGNRKRAIRDEKNWGLFVDNRMRDRPGEIARKSRARFTGNFPGSGFFPVIPALGFLYPRFW
jgi:hypothetical protein